MYRTVITFRQAAVRGPGCLLTHSTQSVRTHTERGTHPNSDPDASTRTDTMRAYACMHARSLRDTGTTDTQTSGPT
jgi:hypothetical protein